MNGRLRLYARSLGSAYGLLAVNTVYSLASIPLAIHYLGKSVFGLWALTLQIGVVLRLADAGFGGALVRILIDHKDDRDGIGYRQTLYTTWAALLVLGLTAGGLVFSCREWITSLLAIPEKFDAFYPKFLGAYLVVFFSSFGTKPIALVLGAHQRNDLVNGASAAGLLVGFGVLFFGLRAGWGLWTLLWVQLTGAILCSIFNFFQSLRLGLLPGFRLTDCLSTASLRDVAGYGCQRIVATFGYTVLLATPTFLITRFLGLDATAAWTVGTRMQQLGSLVASKITETAYSPLAEMYVRGETKVLRKRYYDTLVVAASLAIVIGGGLAACNRDFIALWTGGKVEWSSTLDLTLGMLLFVMIVQKAFWLPVSISKNLGLSRYMTLFEGLVAGCVVLLWPKDSLGLLTVVIALLVAGVSTTLPVYVLRSATVLHLRQSELYQMLVRLTARFILPVMLAGFLLSICFHADSWPMLVVKAVIILTIGMGCVVLLPESRQCGEEMVTRLIRRPRKQPIEPKVKERTQ